MSYKIGGVASLFFIISSFSLSAQSLEIDGNMKIGQMDNNSNSDSIVVWQSDSTLAIRDASSLIEYQVLTLSNDTLFLSNGGFIVLPPDLVNDADADPSNEIETWSTLAGIPIGFSDDIDNTKDADADSLNEIQDISLDGVNLTISDGSTVDLTTVQDGTGTDNQTISLSGTTLSIENGNNINLAPLHDEIKDTDGNTKIQTEQSMDEDIIRFDIDGAERMVLNNRGLEVKSPGFSTFVGTLSGQNDDGSSNRNTYLGYHAGRTNTSGHSNTAVGYKALDVNTGNLNTAIGRDALLKNQGGLNNTAIGSDALEDNTSGDFNVAVGQGALLNTTTGNYNVAVGQGALGASGLLSDNVGIGGSAGSQNAGKQNTFIGRLAGNNSSGDGNVLIGYSAGQLASGGNKLYIDNSATNSPLIYGEFDNDLIKINGKLQISDYSFPIVTGSAGAVMLAKGQNPLEWSPYFFPLTSGTTDQVLKLNNSGFLVWDDIGGVSGNIKEIADADDDTKIEVEKINDEDKIRMTVDGTETLVIEKVNNTTRIDIRGNGNLIVGDSAGVFNIADVPEFKGVRNVYLGNFAGKSDPDGYGNTMIGYQSGEFGNGGRQLNTAVGIQSGWKNDGNQNTFIGHSTGRDNLTGNNNTFVGSSAGRSSSGSSNIFIGYNSGEFESASHKLYIDNSNTSTPLLYGDFASDQLTTNGDQFISGKAVIGLTDTITSSNLRIHSNDTISSVHLTAGTGLSNNDSEIFFAENMDATGGMTWRYNGSKDEMQLYGNYVDTIVGPHLVINRDNGNVTIGDIESTDYRLSVDGKIICEEVRVDLTDNWPDYVFSDSYRLKPLTEVRDFIAEYGHLPNVPNATEVETDGVEIGEMQRLMMEKIEELTLYILRLDEENKELKSRIEQIDHK